MACHATLIKRMIVEIERQGFCRTGMAGLLMTNSFVSKYFFQQVHDKKTVGVGIRDNSTDSVRRLTLMMMGQNRFCCRQRAGMISATQFNLQGTVMNGVLLFKYPDTFINECIARMAVGHDQMHSQGTFGSTQTPNM
jgi:hypothetical protein